MLASLISAAFLFSLDQSPKEQNKTKKQTNKSFNQGNLGHSISFQTFHSMSKDWISRFNRWDMEKSPFIS